MVMQVTDVIVHTLSAGGGEAADDWSDACIVEVQTDEGITGIGEADSSPTLVEAVIDAPTSHEKSSGLREVVVGGDPFNVEVLWDEMFERSYYHGRKGVTITAISAIDIALWDIIGKATDRPLYALLGGKRRDRVRAYASTLFPDDPDDFDHVTREAETALAEGFTAIKFGWGCFGADADVDDQLVERAREVAGPDVDLMIDAGMAWGSDIKGAIRRIEELDERHDIYWVEEPVYADDYRGYSRLADACATRIVGGENEYTSAGFRNFLEYGQPDGVQPDVARAGGITQMRRIAALADDHGLPIYPHGYGTPVIIAANLHLIAATQNASVLEYTRESGPIRNGIIEESFPIKNGTVAVPDGPGLGVTLDRSTVEAYSTNPRR
jgi:L-alanine-DL-glutamate epimerase-like enolase superfamily enzyme